MKKNLRQLFLRGTAASAVIAFSGAMASAAVVKGTVKDASGEPLIGATVSVKGTGQAVATDIDGNFSIDAQPGQSIVINYLGYVPVTEKFVREGKTVFNVVLEPTSTMLEETVVVGYATQKKVNLTGSVSAIGSKDIENIPVANTATLLQGRLPGLVLTNNGAQAGADNPEIRIRGVGTFGNNNPMVLIDGVEGSLSQISSIPAADIENISVLKDAASAAIYGVRAANGVILITTKRGKASEHPNITYQGTYTLQTPGTMPNFVDGYNWALMRNEVKPGTYDDVALQKLKDGSDPDHYANTDWLDAVMRNASMHQHHLSVSGGTENTHYMASLSYQNQDGIMIHTGVERIGFRTNLDTKYKRFSFGLNASGTKTNVEAPGVAAANDAGSVMRFVSWFTRPTVPLMYSNGYYGYVDGSWDDAEMIKNPLESMAVGSRKNNTWLFNGKVWAALDIWDGLKYQINMAYNFNFNATKSYSPKSLARYDAAGNIKKAPGETNSQTDYYYRDETYTIENLITYNKDFGAHTLGVILGHSAIGSQWYKTQASKQGFPTENIYELDGGTVNPSASGSSEEYRLQSFFGRLTYSYDSRYLFEFNIRHDGSSRMPKAHRYATFPSVSLGWVFTNEKFWEPYAQYLSMGKLRASWGKLGNQEIGNYAYTATLKASGNYYFDQSNVGNKQAGMIQASVPNENIKWETTRSTNIGLDLGFLNNRVTATFEYFDKKTSDILMQLSMPGIFLGSLSAPYQNVGAVKNNGWELSMNYMDGHGDWTWNAGFSVSHVRNKIVSMGNLEERINGNTINRVGEPIGAFYGYKAIGIYRTEADLNRTNSKGEVIKQNGQAPKLGDIMYADLDDSGNITSDDRDIIGNPFPKFSYAFNLGATWRNFDLSLFFQGVGGINRYCWETTSDIRGNLTDRFLDRWSPDNVGGSMPALRTGSMNDEYSSFWLEDASYLRLKNLEFGYTFRQKGLAKAGISNIRLFFTGGNLLTFTHLKNWDPEKFSSDARNDAHPSARTYSFGVNVNF